MDFGSIIRRSWEIVKREKVLWVFATVLVAFSGGGMGNINSVANSGSSIFKDKQTVPETGKKISQVLGTATTNPQQFFQTILGSVPPLFWVALGLGFIVAVLFGIVYFIYVRNWALGALWSQCREAGSGNPTSLKMGSREGRKHWKDLFLTSLLPWLLFAGIAGVLAIILVIPMIFLAGSPLIIILFLVMTIVLIALMIYLVYTMLWQTFAQLSVILENFSWQEALPFGRKLTHAFFIDALLMGFINQGIGCAVGCLASIILGILALIVFVLFVISHFLGGAFLVILSIPAIIFLFGWALLSGIMLAFSSCNWVLFYQELQKKEEYKSIKR